MAKDGQKFLMHLLNLAVFYGEIFYVLIRTEQIHSLFSIIQCLANKSLELKK